MSLINCELNRIHLDWAGLNSIRLDCVALHSTRLPFPPPLLPLQRKSSAGSAHIFHFSPPGWPLGLTVAFPAAAAATPQAGSVLDESTVAIRRQLHRALGLEMDRPLLRTANAIAFRAGRAAGGSDEKRQQQQQQQVMNGWMDGWGKTRRTVTIMTLGIKSKAQACAFGWILT